MLTTWVAQRRQTLRRKPYHLFSHDDFDTQVLTEAEGTQWLMRPQPQLLAQGFRFSLCFCRKTVGEFRLSNH